MRTKYIEIKDYLSDLIGKGEDGGILPSERQLCEYMDVSRVTVRRAIGELEHDGLIKRQKGIGAFINKKNGSQGALNLFLGIPEKIGGEVVEPPIIGCIDSVINRDIALHLFNTRGDISKTVERVTKYDTHGVVGIQPGKPDYPVYEELRKRGYPVLLINRIIKNSHYSYVSTDYPANGFRSTEYLLNKGHQKILFVGLSSQLHYSSHIHKGYVEALQKNGINDYETMTFYFPENMPLDSFFVDVARDFSDRIRQFDFSAVVVASGGIFEKVVLPVFNKHTIKIPEDVEVVVHDRVTAGCPVKKYVHELIQPDYEIGVRAIIELEKLVKGQRGKVRELIPSEFVIKSEGSLAKSVV
jgi:GntR family transcriptional regulator, arabinose operon transcriptional repressor